MPTSLIDWTVRMVMLVLAGLVTLSILGSIAAMSNDTGPLDAGVFGDRSAPSPAPPDQAVPTDAAEANVQAPAPTGGITATASDEPGSATMTGAPREPRERWLEAIAYALLALAGLFALAILLLWRTLHHLRRIADATEGHLRN
jgi:hypothetical protein